MGAMLSFSRGLFFACKNQENLAWPRKEIVSYCKMLRDSNLVILGFGKIGNWIAKLAKPFGVHITGVKRKLIEKPDFFDEDDKIISIDNLDTILPGTDHLVLALPSDKSTDNIIDKQKLDLLPNHCYIYNIGRGNSIDELALAEALNEGKLKGAYLDVFKKELGQDFVVIAIHASKKIRYKRAMNRGRFDDSNDIEAIKARDQREIKWGISVVIASADIVISNEGTIDEFRDKIKNILRDLQ